jgi:hypothetical protein
MTFAATRIDKPAEYWNMQTFINSVNETATTSNRQKRMEFTRNSLKELPLISPPINGHELTQEEIASVKQWYQCHFSVLWEEFIGCCDRVLEGRIHLLFRGRT